VPIAAIVDRAHRAADLDGILVRLREAIAAADYPYPIDQDLDELRTAAKENTQGRDYTPKSAFHDD
jgi:cardiolipin synthase C